MKLFVLFVLAFYFIDADGSKIGDKSCTRSEIKTLKLKFLDFIDKFFSKPTSPEKHDNYLYFTKKCAAHLDEGIRLVKQIKENQKNSLIGLNLLYYLRYLCSVDEQFFRDNYSEALLGDFFRDCLIPVVGGTLTKNAFNTSDDDISLYERADFCSVELTEDLMAQVLSSAVATKCNKNGKLEHQLKGMMMYGKANNYCGEEHPMYFMIHLNEYPNKQKQ